MSRRLREKDLSQMDELPDWVDRYSVTCCICGDLADERETTKLTDDREAHPECVDTIKVVSTDLPDDNIGGYVVARTRVTISGENGVLWQGEINDAGGFVYGDFKSGSVKPYNEFEDFDFPGRLGEFFGVGIDTLIMGNVNPAETATTPYEEGEVLELKQYQCKKCGVLFYLEKLTPTDSIDFGCPNACDEGLIHVRTIRTKIENMIEQEEEILDF